MNTLNFPDVNVWLALLWKRHADSTVVQAWFDSVEQAFVCRFTQLGLLRLLTTASVLGPDTKAMDDAWLLWDEMISDSRLSFLDEPVGIEPHFRSYSRLRTASPKVWADAYLLAFASAMGCRIVTFDRALAARASSALLLSSTPT